METVTLIMPNFVDTMNMEIAVGIVKTLLTGVRIEKEGKVYVPSIILKEEDNSRNENECISACG